MANLYTPYKNGTFEYPLSDGFAFPNSMVQPYHPTSGVVGAMTLTTEHKITGTRSALVKMIQNDSTADPGAQHSKVAIMSPFRSKPPGSNPIVLTVGIKYTIQVDIFIPAGEPIAEDDAILTFSGDEFGIDNAFRNNNASSIQDLGGGKYKFTTNGGAVEYDGYKISALKGNTTTIFYTWIEPASDFAYNTPALSIILTDASGGTSIIPAEQHFLLNGKMFFDNIILDETPVCNLTFNNPAFDKTDETVALNDGTVTVHATGTGTLQYKLDAGAYQLSSVFTGLAPGTYNIIVKDSTACGTITIPVTILAYNAPPPPPPPPAGILQMDEQPVNMYNFMSWFPCAGELGFTDGIECINQFWDLPRGYRLNAITHQHFAVVMQNEDFSFYINFDVACTYPSFTNLKVALITSGGVIKADCGVLKKDANADNSYNIYATINLDATIPEGVYRLLIYDFVTNNTLYISSGIEVMTENDAKSQTVRIIHRNTYDIYKYYYSRIPDYVNQIRLKMNLADEEPEATISNYRAVSSGRLRNVNIELDKWIQLEAYYFDDLAIRGMYVFQICDTININGKNYILKDIYKTTWVPKLCINKGLISFYEQEFSTANRFGIPGNLTVVGSDDPLLMGDGGGFIKL